MDEVKGTIGMCRSLVNPVLNYITNFNIARHHHIKLPQVSTCTSTMIETYLTPRFADFMVFANFINLYINSK